MKLFPVCLCTLLFPAFAGAQNTDELLPIPIELIMNFKHDALEPQVKEIAFFSDIDEAYDASPMSLLISLANRDKSMDSAMGFTSLMLTSGTLGLIPMATENDLILRYEIILHGALIAKYEYARNFRGSEHMWSTDFYETGQQLDEDMLEWISSTVAEFAEEINNDPGLFALQVDYNHFFVSSGLADET